MKTTRGIQNFGKYAQTGTQGARLPGWHGLNCVLLAVDLGKSTTHIRDVLAGRAGVSLDLIERIAEALRLRPGEVVERIIAAREKDEERLRAAKLRWAQRQVVRRRIVDTGYSGPAGPAGSTDSDDLHQRAGTK